MAHGKTLDMRAIKSPAPGYVKRYFVEQLPNKLLVEAGDWSPHTNPERDRSLPGKARRRLRREARRLQRTPFFKGYGIAGANDYNVRYDCHAPDCGFIMLAPLDDHDFITDVMDHEQQHADAEVAS